ncbi:MAG TPA: VWA domain-containing protein [Gemmataceae bacterium]|nr:VWA domain-containing protein [Pirellulales bacterium]HZZ80234.1 VWA domain-containing protein [Gemmataceae bacterium]
MKLEKATAHSNEASLAGWISSNDVTLLTMVLVVMIALFLHTKLVKGSKENASLVGEKSTLAATLATTESELHRASASLQDSHQKLRLTEEQRNKLDTDLQAALRNINDLNSRLSALVAAKSKLEQQEQELLATKEALTGERDQLAAQQQTLTAARDVLIDDKASLTKQLTQIADQLSAKLQLLEDAEKDRDRLAKQAEELESIVTALTGKLESANENLAATKKQAQAARGETDKRIQSLESELATGNKRAEEYLAQLKRATEALQGLSLEKRKIETRLDQAEQQRELALLRETRLNRELVGLKGKLTRVAVLFDASGSMNAKSADQRMNRWTEAQQIAGTWLRYLDAEECVLIVFSSDVRTFPEDGSFARLRGAGSDERRQQLLKSLERIEPKGWTNTLGALQKAYEYPGLDTIILFSDGAPTNVNLGRFDAAVADEIYRLCRRYPDVPINTIGLGNYFEQDLSTFLTTVARITGGAFQGR